MDPLDYQSKPPEPPPPPPPPRAFTQGVGTVFQFTGVILFLCMMFICCGSSLLSKQTAMRNDLPHIGWHLRGDLPDQPTISAQKMMTAAVAVGIVLGMALAGIGLGLQAMRRRTPWAAAAVTLVGTLFWAIQTVFVVQILHSVFLILMAPLLTLGFASLFGFSIAAIRDMIANPPAHDMDLLPDSFENPHSHLNQDAPEVRLARDLAQRKAKLVVQQKEIEGMERSLARKMKNKET